MSSETLFGDEIVQITEFKKHAKTYADRARQRPLTIAQGSVADLALMRRALVAEAFSRHRHLIQALDLLMHEAQGAPLRVVTWAADLDPDERHELAAEYASAIQRAEALGTSQAWETVDEVLDDWAATAEAVQNDELLMAVERRRTQEKQGSTRPSSGDAQGKRAPRRGS